MTSAAAPSDSAAPDPAPAESSSPPPKLSIKHKLWILLTVWNYEKARKAVALVLLLAIVCAAVSVQFIKNTQDAFVDLLQWFKDNDFGGGILLLFLYCLCILVWIPGKALLAVGSGYFYGFGVAFVILYISSILAAAIAFVVGRFAKPYVLQFAQKYFVRKFGEKKWIGLIKLLETESFRTCLALRLLPIPREPMNYFLAVSPISTKHYFSATALALLVSNMIIFIWIGSTLKDVQEVASGGKSKGSYVSIILGAVLVVIAVSLGFFLYRRARKMFENLDKEPEQSPGVQVSVVKPETPAAAPETANP